jgi:hypothetical protein
VNEDGHPIESFEKDQGEIAEGYAARLNNRRNEVSQIRAQMEEKELTARMARRAEPESLPSTIELLTRRGVVPL